MIRVEVVYALPDVQYLQAVTLPIGATVADALQAVAEREGFRELDLFAMPVGVYGEACEPERYLVDGDRVELYRPLILDPKEARRLRAENKLD